MRVDLTDDPSVIAMAGTLAMDEYAVVGRLHRLWVWANRHLSSGDAPGVTEPWIDRYVSTPGFAAAMLAAGWLRSRSGGVEFPNFERWNSQGAKRRILTAQRMKSHRDAKSDAPSVTPASPEKRREEKREREPPNPPKPGGKGRKKPRSLDDIEQDPRFVRFWTAYPKKVGKIDAAKAFTKIDPGPELLEEIMAGLEAWKHSHEWTKDGGGFIKHAEGWLNGKRWREQPTNGKPSQGRTISDLAANTLETLFDDVQRPADDGPRIVQTEPADVGDGGRMATTALPSATR